MRHAALPELYLCCILTADALCADSDQCLKKKGFFSHLFSSLFPISEKGYFFQYLQLFSLYLTSCGYSPKTKFTTVCGLGLHKKIAYIICACVSPLLNSFTLFRYVHYQACSSTINQLTFGGSGVCRNGRSAEQMVKSTHSLRKIGEKTHTETKLAIS